MSATATIKCDVIQLFGTTNWHLGALIQNSIHHKIFNCIHVIWITQIVSYIHGL